MLSDAWLALLDNWNVVAIVLSVNVCLTAMTSLLEMWKDKTTTEVDNKLHAWLSSVVPSVQKIVDWLSANKKH